MQYACNPCNTSFTRLKLETEAFYENFSSFWYFIFLPTNFHDKTDSIFLLLYSKCFLTFHSDKKQMEREDFWKSAFANKDFFCSDVVDDLAPIFGLFFLMRLMLVKCSSLLMFQKALRASVYGVKLQYHEKSLSQTLFIIFCFLQGAIFWPFTTYFL